MFAIGASSRPGFVRVHYTRFFARKSPPFCPAQASVSTENGSAPPEPRSPEDVIYARTVAAKRG